MDDKDKTIDELRKKLYKAELTAAAAIFLISEQVEEIKALRKRLKEVVPVG